MAKITLECSEKPIVEQYRRMRTDGIADLIIDASIDQKPDNTITCAEIVNSSVEHADRYHSFLSTLTGRRVPWLLDDHNAKTKFDAKIRKQISSAIKLAKGALEKNGLFPKDPEYKKDLADAIYLFAYAPSAKSLPIIKKYYPHVMDAFLPFFKHRGMPELHDLILREGGLGLSQFSGDAPLEASALESLEQNKGLCTERSKIIYAIFKEAGLNPYFAFMGVKDIRVAWANMFGSSKSPPIQPDDYFGGHIVVGIPNGDDPMYYEPNMVLPDVNYDKHAKPISLREMYQIDLGNFILHLNDAGQLDAAGRAIAGAKALGKSMFLSHAIEAEGKIHLNLARAANSFNNTVAANAHINAAAGLFTQALSLNPNRESAHISLCELLTDAKKCWDDLPDDVTQKHLGFARIASQEGRFAAARVHTQKAIEMGADERAGCVFIAETYMAEKNWHKAKEYLERVLKEKPGSFKANLLLSSVCQSIAEDAKCAASTSKTGGFMRTIDSGGGLMGLVKHACQTNFAEAEAALKKALAIDSSSPEAIIGMARFMVKLGRIDEARHYFKRYLMGPTFDEFTLDTYMDWADLADRLGVWEEFGYAAKRLHDNFVEEGGTTISIELSIYDPWSHIDQRRSWVKEQFRRLMDKISESASMLPMPPNIYWRMAGIAERVGEWDSLFKMCKAYENNTAYGYAFLLHSAWKSGRRDLIKEGETEFSQRIATIQSVPENQRSIEGMEQVAKYIEAVEKDIELKPTLSGLFANYFNLLANTYRQNGMAAKAEAAKQKATRYGMIERGR